MRKKYWSRTSLLIIVVIFGLFGAMAYRVIGEFIENSVSTLGIIIMPTTFMIVCLFCFTINYEITATKLVIRLWFIEGGSIDLKEISAVRRSFNPISSPASSLKRLEISYGKVASAIISPRREKEFIEVLKERCPKARIEIVEKRSLLFWILGLDI